MSLAGALILATASATAAAPPAATTTKHLFLDGAIVANSSGVDLVRHRPSRGFPSDGGRVLWPEHPWEAYQGPGTYGGVMRAADGTYRCYYLCRGEQVADVKTCLATSKNGVVWVKPTLNLVSWKGSSVVSSSRRAR